MSIGRSEHQGDAACPVHNIVPPALDQALAPGPGQARGRQDINAGVQCIRPNPFCDLIPPQYVPGLRVTLPLNLLKHKPPVLVPLHRLAELVAYH